MAIYEKTRKNTQFLTDFVSIVCLAAFLVGCQNADDQYQIITEEISQSDANPAATTTVDEEPATDTPSPATSSNATDDNTPADVEKNKPEQIADSGKNSETSANNADMVEETEGQSTDKVKEFINLEEEIARQERLNKLGLGETIESAEPREPKLLVKEREFVKENDAQAWRVSYDDLDLLKILNMQPVPLNAVDYLPDWLTQLEGKRIILRGWMFPPDRAEGIKGFIFVRDNQVCCFGPNAKAYDKLTVRLKSGSTTNFIQGRPFDVIGTFKIDPWIEDERDMKTGEFVEKIGMLYHLEDAVIVDKK